MNKFYITTPVYYINDIPHVGHAYTTIAADVLARYYRTKFGEKNVYFLTGTDEHGAKIAEAAKSKNQDPQQFVDELVPKFKNTWKNLNISYDVFFRTTNPKHEKFVQDFLIKLKEKGLIYKKKYEGLYCVGCEKFVLEKDLKDGKCPDHPNKKIICHSEENWFFKLSEFQKPLLNAIKNKDYEILPITRKNEVVSKIKMGLEDLSISRAGVKWGIPLPWDKSQTIYVWVDALLNYLSVLEINKKLNFWPADIHIMAKDILWFHAVIWPALLLAHGSIGDSSLKLPKVVFAHGFFTINGQKMSKTVGNVIDPNIWVNKYGADAVRYYLLTAFPFGEDGNVSEEELANKYNNELANELGNLVNRVVAMTKNYLGFSITVKNNKQLAKIKEETRLKINLPKFNLLIENLKFNEALIEIWKIVRLANEFIEQEKPWQLNKDNKVRLEYVLVNLTRAINGIQTAITPFCPTTAEKIKDQFQTLTPKPLFPRLN